jgi:hypothetical protein
MADHIESHERSAAYTIIILHFSIHIAHRLSPQTSAFYLFDLAAFRGPAKPTPIKKQDRIAAPT